jgi:hypothetical protein
MAAPEDAASSHSLHRVMAENIEKYDRALGYRVGCINASSIQRAERFERMPHLRDRVTAFEDQLACQAISAASAEVQLSSSDAAPM